MLSLTGQELVNLVGAVIGVVLVLSGVIAVGFSQLRKNTTQIVRDENEDLRKRLITVESLEERCKERLAKAEAQIQMLTDTVTGATAVVELSKLVAAHHDEAVGRLDAVLAHLVAIDQRLT